MRGLWSFAAQSTACKTNEVAARELYDHAAEPHEMRNIAGRPENAELIRKLSNQLRAGWQAALPPE